MKRKVLVCFFSIFLVSSGTAFALPSHVVLFGDSLSDTGNMSTLTGGALPASPPYAPDRASNGPLWIDHLASDMGLGINTVWTGNPGNPGILQGPGYVDNLSVFGAFSGPLSIAGVGVSNAASLIVGAPLPGLREQLGLYQSLGVDPDALHLLWIGSNDLIFTDLVIGAPTLGDAIVELVDNIQAALVGLSASGAQELAVVNLPNVGQTPVGGGVTEQLPFLVADRSQELAIASASFNILLADMIDALLFDVQLVDIATLFDSFVSDPARFGFTNTEDPCFFDGQRCGNEDEFLFFDEVHPTAAAHRFLADPFKQALDVPEPATLVLLAIGMIAVVRYRSLAGT